MTWIRAGALQGFEQVLGPQYVDHGAVLRKSGIDPGKCSDPDELIPLKAVAQVLEAGATVSGIPDFGLRLSAAQGLDMLGALSVLLQSSKSLHEAFFDVSRYLRFHSDGYDVSLDLQCSMFENCCSLKFDINVPGQACIRQLIDGCIGFTYRSISALVDNQFDVKHVFLPHTPVAEESVYRRFFRAPVSFGHTSALLVVHRSVLETPLKTGSPQVRRMARMYFEDQFLVRSRVRIHNQNMTTAANAHADRKTLGHLS